jgi:hypothetical protein
MSLCQRLVTNFEPLASIAGSLGLVAGGAGGTLSDTAQRLISFAASQQPAPD